jgi:5-methylcytosine-specific restriction endonuclease McrA
MPKDPLDYQKNRAWYIARETSEAGKNKRVERAQARTKAVKSGMLASKHDPREVDHKRPMDKGGGNGKGNLQVLSRKANRRKYDH